MFFFINCNQLLQQGKLFLLSPIYVYEEADEATLKFTFAGLSLVPIFIP